MAAQIPTVATQLLKNLRMRDIIDANFNTINAFMSAIKVFRMSFFSTTNKQLYEQKFIEYLNAMKDLYFIQNIDLDQTLRTIDQQINDEIIEITIGVIQFEGRGEMTGPRVVIYNGVSQKVFDLDVNRKVQTNAIHVETIRFKDFRDKIEDQKTLWSKTKNENAMSLRISIGLEADKWNQLTERLNVFRVNYQEIYAKGFQDWFDFGRGVQLLIKIDFRVTNEANVTEKIVSNFHFHTILSMLYNRIQRFRAENRTGTGHRVVAHKANLTYIRKRVDPNSNEAFWSTPNNSIQIQDIAYNDMQIGLYFYDEFEDRVCLCSEWCNWNAFFHYNPIYRFLMVRHNQLYLQNRTNTSDMYLFAAIANISFAANNIHQNPVIPKTPLFLLMSCANDYRNRFYYKHYLQSITTRNQIFRSYPSVLVMNGLSYVILRNHEAIPDLCVQSASNPFADLCIENILNYYKVLTDLHVFLSTVRPYVPSDEISDWFNELDQMGRRGYMKYIELSYDIILANPAYSSDHLFTEDFEYSNVFIESNDEIEIKAIRDNVYRIGSEVNPFNIEIICNNIIVAFAAINKLVQFIDRQSIVYSQEAFVDVLEFCTQMDSDFTNYLTQNTNQNPFNFFIDKRELEKTGLEEEYLIVFYTLKLYSICFGIQKYFINSVVNSNTEEYSPIHQTCSQFNFIWKNDLIERKFRNRFPNEKLYRISPEFRYAFKQFYTAFWGRAEHETNPSTNLLDYIDSGFHEYKRLYFWWNNDGNNRLKFTRIFSTLFDNFDHIIRVSEGIYLMYILKSIRVLSQKNFEYYLEVLDHLVYYLVKSACSLILSTTAAFLKEVHYLQVEDLATAGLSYSMCKPGWVHIFRTMRTVFDFIEKLKTFYIVFDDEFNRIANTLIQTKQLIKDIYKDFYNKLSIEWIAEIDCIYESVDFSHHTTGHFIGLHLLAGVGFLGAFIDDFRGSFDIVRRQYQKYMSTPNAVLTHHRLLNECEPLCRQYLCNRNAVQQAMPFLDHIWQYVLFVTFAAVKHADPNSLRIDLDLANE